MTSLLREDVVSSTRPLDYRIPHKFFYKNQSTKHFSQKVPPRSVKPTFPIGRDNKNEEKFY